MTRVFKRRSYRSFVLVLLGLVAATAARAQESLQRFERQLEQIRRDTVLQINPAVPVDQRLLLDYGGDFCFGFPSGGGKRKNKHNPRRAALIRDGPPGSPLARVCSDISRGRRLAIYSSATIH